MGVFQTFGKTMSPYSNVPKRPICQMPNRAAVVVVVDQMPSRQINTLKTVFNSWRENEKKMFLKIEI